MVEKNIGESSYIGRINMYWKNSVQCYDLILDYNVTQDILTAGLRMHAFIITHKNVS